MNVVAAHIPEDNKLQKFNFIVTLGPLNYPSLLKEQALTSSLTRLDHLACIPTFH